MPGNYNLTFYTAYTTSSSYEIFTANAAINPSNIPTLTVNTLTSLNNAPTVLVIQFVSPVLIYDGYRMLNEPYKISGKIDLLFRMSNTGVSWFGYDLGSGIADGQSFPCEIANGLIPSIFTSSVSCILIQGPSSSPTDTSITTISISNFHGVDVGSTITINIPLINAQGIIIFIINNMVCVSQFSKSICNNQYIFYRR